MKPDEPGLPAVPSAFVGAFGGRWWNEGRAPLERLQLAATRIPLADGGGRRVVLVNGYLDGGVGGESPPCATRHSSIN